MAHTSHTSSEPRQPEHRDNYHADNGQYVVLLSDDGSKILVSQTQANYMGIPELGTDEWPEECKNYRDAVCRILSLGKLDIQVIETLTFPEYNLSQVGDSVSLTIIETLSYDAPVRCPLTWVDWKHDFAFSDSTRKHPAVSRYLRAFLDNLGYETQRNMNLPWYCFGYYRKIRPLLMERVEKLGYEVSAEPKQVRFSIHSSTYRIPSEPDHLFFKACPGGCNEMFMTQLMFDFFPKDVVPVIGLVPELNGILTLNVGPNLRTLLWDSPDTRRRQEYSDTDRILDSAMRYWADFQQRSSSCVSKLKANDVTVCDEAWMKEGVKELRAYCRQHKILSQEQLEFLEICDEKIEETFALWKASGIPETVVHGDLCDDNLAQPGGPGTPFVVLDLRTVFIGYPFFDLRNPKWSMLHKSETTYLQCWKHYADMDTINALAEMTRPMDYLISPIARIRDKALGSEFVASDIEPDLRVFIQEMKQGASDYASQHQSD